MGHVVDGELGALEGHEAALQVAVDQGEVRLEAEVGRLGLEPGQDDDEVLGGLKAQQHLVEVEQLQVELAFVDEPTEPTTRRRFANKSAGCI